MIIRFLLLSNLASAALYETENIRCKINESKRKNKLSLEIDLDEFIKDGKSLDVFDISAKLNPDQNNLEEFCEIQYRSADNIQPKFKIIDAKETYDGVVGISTMEFPENEKLKNFSGKELILSSNYGSQMANKFCGKLGYTKGKVVKVRIKGPVLTSYSARFHTRPAFSMWGGDSM